MCEKEKIRGLMSGIYGMLVALNSLLGLHFQNRHCLLSLSFHVGAFKRSVCKKLLGQGWCGDELNSFARIG